MYYECFIDSHETTFRKNVFIELMNKSKFIKLFSQVKSMNLVDKGDVAVYKNGEEFFGCEFAELADLIGKVGSQRLLNQSLELSTTYPYRALIINREGRNMNDYKSRLEENYVIANITETYFQIGVPVFIWDSSFQQIYSCVKAIEDLIDPDTTNPKEKITATIKTGDMFIKMLGQIRGLNKNKLIPLKQEYGSIAELSKATEIEIQKSNGIGKTLAEKIYGALHS